MLSLTLPLIALFAVSWNTEFVFAQDDSSKCEVCDDDSCIVRDNVRVEKLCADELCVGGKRVIIGDDNPCTSDDWDSESESVVHVPIKDCCRDSSDCQQFMPDSCHLSECWKDDESDSHGYCIHLPLKPENCCDHDDDCPKRPCETAECVPRNETDPLFVQLSAGANKMTLLSPQEKVFSAPGTCVYTDVDESEDCCVVSDDCKEGRSDQVGFCDANNECVYVTTTQFECTEDEDCATKDPGTTAKCRNKGQCFDNVCDRGWCACVFDKNVDADNDGVCCQEDCDDNDPSVGVTILCPEGDLDVIDPDIDQVYECGIWVEEVCVANGTEICPNGAVPIDRNQTETSGHNAHKLFLAYDCDCCSDAPGPDEFTFCGANVDGDECFALVNSTAPLAEQCAKKVCVSVVPSEPGQPKVVPTDEQRNEQCASVDENFPLYVPPEKRAGPCDLCDETEGIKETRKCPNTFLDDEQFSVAVCSSEDVETENPNNACCATIVEVCQNSNECEGSGLQPFYTCCQQLIAVFEGSIPDNATCDNGFEPINFEACSCVFDSTTETCIPVPQDEYNTFNDQIAYEGEAVVISCVPDKDHDLYYNCADKEYCCVQLPVCRLGDGEEPDPNVDDPHGIVDKVCNSTVFEIDFGGEELTVSAEAEHLLCKLKPKTLHPRGGYRFALGEQSEENVQSGEDFDGTYCDCNDKMQNAFQLIACISDQDGDGFPVQNQGGVAECTQLCAAECPAGTTPIDDLAEEADCGAPAPSPSPLLKRDLDAIEQIAAKHNWFNKRSVTPSPSPSPSQKPDLPPRREDEECDNLICGDFDCCDLDAKVYPGSPFASSVANACGDFDNNCDGCINSFAACPGDAERDGAQPCEDRPEFFNVTGDSELGDELPNPSDDYAQGIYYASSDEIRGDDNPEYKLDNKGKCTFLELDDGCNFINGWNIEHDDDDENTGPQLRKRQIPENPFCTNQNTVHLTSDDLDNVNNATFAINTPAPGTCAEFLQSCKRHPDACSVDTEICLKITI